MKITDIIKMTDKITDDWLKSDDEVLRHWGYGSGIEQTTTSSEGTILTLDNLLTPITRGKGGKV